LTGTPSTKSDKAANANGLFLTDVSNASRWLFCDIASVQWDQELVDAVCSPHSVPLSALPEIHASSEVYGSCTKESTGVPSLDGVPVAGLLGDQQAALFGQTAFEPGEAKNTYGTGMFLMMNTGTTPTPSNHGLLTTIAYKIGSEEVVYALEGSVSHSGSTIQWLRDQLQIIKEAPESETYATDHNDGLYFVPAFSGLFAPHWRSDARACIVGMTASHHKGHICRAALEAAAYQAREVFDAIYKDSKVLLKNLKVDGGGTNNKLLMQFQADIINVPVVQPKIMETTAMGAAFCAGLAVGVWKDLQEIRDLWSVSATFSPTMTEAEREKNLAGWRKAISKSLDWVEGDEGDQFHDSCQDDFELMNNPLSPKSRKKAFGARDGEGASGGGYSTASLLLVTMVGFGAGVLLERSHRRK
jgi:glycerol kinase